MRKEKAHERHERQGTSFPMRSFTFKFTAWVNAALPLFARAGIGKEMDQGCIELTGAESVAGFVAGCRKIRMWEREASVSA